MKIIFYRIYDHFLWKREIMCACCFVSALSFTNRAFGSLWHATAAVAAIDILPARSQKHMWMRNFDEAVAENHTKRFWSSFARIRFHHVDEPYRTNIIIDIPSRTMRHTDTHTPKSIYVIINYVSWTWSWMGRLMTVSKSLKLLADGN